ncbi:hypothetical protein JKP88DRAFT_236198 [Tribonema minus]|uniref:DoxX family protein n=1 Tax=Tribonema minus TaxID=303371 RepID=A0A835Z408_9STRA|nr:hypothetical protein JKP88DRAFT_236198 [Tribonema minus]
MGSSLLVKVVHAVAGVLAIGSIMAGFVKLSPLLNSITHEEQVHKFATELYKPWDFLGLTPDQLRMLVGCAEMATGLGSLVKATRLASYVVMVVIYGGAVRTHFALHDNNVGPAAVFLLLACFCLGLTLRAPAKKPEAKAE